VFCIKEWLATTLSTVANLAVSKHTQTHLLDSPVYNYVDMPR